MSRPVRTVAVGAGIVAPICAGSAFAFSPDRPIMVAVAVGYGVLLNSYVVGLLLASAFRATRWWFFGLALPLICAGIVAMMLGYWPESIMWPVMDPVLRVAQFVLVSWLSVGFILSSCGWWAYPRHRRTITNAQLERDLTRLPIGSRQASC